MLSFHMLQQSSNDLSLKLTLELLSLKHFLCMSQDLIALKWFPSRVILGDLISPQHKIWVNNHIFLLLLLDPSVLTIWFGY